MAYRAEGRKYVRVPAALKRNLEDAVRKNKTIWTKCPFGHDIWVTVSVEYVSQGGSSPRLDLQIQRTKSLPIGESTEGGKFVRVPVGLRRSLETVVFKSRTILINCPFGHDVRFTVSVEYVSKAGPDLRFHVSIQKKKVPPGPKMVQSDEPFTGEHFEALLRSSLYEREKCFVRFFRGRENEPTSPIQWIRAGFLEKTHLRAINSLCRRHRLPISLAQTGEYDVEERVCLERLAKYKFYVMERARGAWE